MHRLLFMIGLLISVAVAGQNKQPVSVTDMLKIKSIGNVTLSPDGSKAAFTVTTIENEGDSKWDYKYVTQVWMAPTDGSTVPRQLTTTRENATQPAWSPDGKQLAFTRVADGKQQIFILSLDGGEARQLTKFKYGAAAPKWSPNGEQILFATGIPLAD
ncbi:MAG TPA: S9 family peptidase, partial [Niastella sp.]